MKTTSDGYWYLASPYSKYPDGIDAAFEDACKVAAKLMDAGFSIYSPIAHTHPVAKYTKADPLDTVFWIKADFPMMESAKGLIVVKMQGWEGSSGVQAEIEYFESVSKPVIYIDEQYPLADLGDQP